MTFPVFFLSLYRYQKRQEMAEATTIIDLLQNIVLPSFTAVCGWFASVWRTKQKKEKDVLDNVQQILSLQKSYIEEQAGTIKESKDINKRLEAKLDKKNKSIRQANKCKYTNEGDGCPVLTSEERFDDCQADCKTCKLIPHEDADS